MAITRLLAALPPAADDEVRRDRNAHQDGATQRSEVQREVRHFLAAPFEHDGGNAGAIPGCIWQVVARGGHELLTVFGANRRPGGFAVVEADDPALLARTLPFSARSST
jgi:hypothetical protein